jgi:hypothetical protein
MMERISWTNPVKNEKVLDKIYEEKISCEQKKRKEKKTNWIGHALRKNCLLKHVIEGKVGGTIEVTGRRGRRHKQLLDYFQERREYWKLIGQSGEQAVKEATGLS